MSENTESTTEIIAESNNFKELKEDVVSFLEFAFKVGLGLGSVIAFCFYFWYVEVMPSMGNIGDITVFLVMVAGVGILVALFVLLLVPALWWNDKKLEAYLGKKINLCFTIKATWLFFGLVAFLNILLLIVFDANSNNSGIAWLFCFLVPYLILFIALKSEKDKMINSTFFIVSLFYSLLISGYTQVSLVNPEKFYSILFIGVITFVNILMSETTLKKFTSETSQQNQNFYRWFPLACIFFIICYLSLVLVNQHKDNFFVTKPFELLKLGDYNATLQFKEDFIQKDNPFSQSNLNNCKEGQFFIRSSIGDEYILETAEEHARYLNERQENNTTKKQFQPTVYRIKKEFVLAEIKPSSDTNTTNINKTWAIDNGCDSYEKVTFKKEFISNNNPFIENEKGCLTKIFWVRDRGATLELKDSNDTESQPYQISSLYIMSRQKATEQDYNATWADCPPKLSKSNANSAILCQIKCDNNQSKNDK